MPLTRRKGKTQENGPIPVGTRVHYSSSWGDGYGTVEAITAHDHTNDTPLTEEQIARMDKRDIWYRYTVAKERTGKTQIYSGHEIRRA